MFLRFVNLYINDLNNLWIIYCHKTYDFYLVTCFVVLRDGTSNVISHLWYSRSLTDSFVLSLTTPLFHDIFLNFTFLHYHYLIGEISLWIFSERTTSLNIGLWTYYTSLVGVLLVLLLERSDSLVNLIFGNYNLSWTRPPFCYSFGQTHPSSYSRFTILLASVSLPLRSSSSRQMNTIDLILMINRNFILRKTHRSGLMKGRRVFGFQLVLSNPKWICVR